MFIKKISPYAAVDKIYEHSGQVIDVKIIKVGESTLSYKYPGEDAEQTIGKLAVEKIVYSSGRTEQVSDKVEIGGKSDRAKFFIFSFWLTSLPINL